MPRTQVTLLAICLALPLPAMAKEACGDRLQGYNIYEELNDAGGIEEKHSRFAIVDWSDASSFEGVLAKKQKEKLTLEVEVRAKAKGPATKTGSWEFREWPRDEKFLVAEGFEPVKFFEGATGYFVLKVKKDGKLVCADPAREFAEY